MQKLLNLCSKYAVDHSLTYNAKKAFSLCFIPRTVKISRPQLYLDTLVIPHVSECKYLGIIVCQKNCDRDHKRQMKKLYANAIMLLRGFIKYSIPVKCYLFKTYCSVRIPEWGRHLLMLLLCLDTITASRGYFSC